MKEVLILTGFEHQDKDDEGREEDEDEEQTMRLKTRDYLPLPFLTFLQN